MITLIRSLCLSGAVFFCTHSLIAQQSDYTNSISQFKARYPKAEVVAVNFSEQYNFTLDKSKTETKVSANCSYQQNIVPLKDYISTADGLFYDDQSAIENVRASSAKIKSIKIPMQCADYESEGIFYSDAKVCMVSIPLETKGLPVNFSYEKKYKDVKYLTSVYFHENIPVEEKAIVFNIPSWLEVELREFNFDGFGITKETKQENGVTSFIYRMKNIPSLQREYNSPNMAKSFPHIIVVSKSFTDNGQKKVLFESVKDLYSWYNSLCKEVKNNPDELKPIVTQLTKDKKTDVEKVESMYYWVQEKVRYIAFENGIMGFRPEPAQNVLKNKYGDCKGKANLITQMLKLAGYDARLTWIGTSDLPYDYSLPSLAVDNHMICTLIMDGKRYYLDGTEENMAFNDYAHRIQGKQVLIQDGDNYIIDKVPEFNAEHNKVETTMKLKLDNLDLKGNVVSTYNGEARNMLVGVYHSLRSENKQNALENFLRSGDVNMIVTNIQNPDWENRQKPARVTFDLDGKNQVTKAGNELYVVLDWEKELSSVEFDSTRKTDFEFEHKYYLVTKTEFTIPDGYKLDYTPDAFTKKGEDYSFEGSYVLQGNTLVYSKKLIVNNVILKKKDFSKWNEFIKGVNKFYNDQVVLVKK